MRAQSVHVRPWRGRRPTVLIGVTVAVALALAGCGGGGSSGATKLDKAAPVTLTWWTGQAQE